MLNFKDFKELGSRARFTGALAGCVVLLELSRHFTGWGDSLFKRSAFKVQGSTWQGFVLSGLFHEGLSHFAANLAGVIIIVGLLEYLVGPSKAGAAFVLGAWISNPLTVLILQPVLGLLAPQALVHFLTEQDYGASNGIYCAVGALSAQIPQPRTLLAPFIMCGSLYAWATGSFLAFQHLIALGSGLALGWRWRQTSPLLTRAAKTKSTHLKRVI